MNTHAITTTLQKIKDCDPCKDGYEKLVKSLGGPKTYGMNANNAPERIELGKGWVAIKRGGHGSYAVEHPNYNGHSAVFASKEELEHFAAAMQPAVSPSNTSEHIQNTSKAEYVSPSAEETVLSIVNRYHVLTGEGYRHLDAIKAIANQHALDAVRNERATVSPSAESVEACKELVTEVFGGDIEEDGSYYCPDSNRGLSVKSTKFFQSIASQQALDAVWNERAAVGDNFLEKYMPENEQIRKLMAENERLKMQLEEDRHRQPAAVSADAVELIKNLNSCAMEYPNGEEARLAELPALNLIQAYGDAYRLDGARQSFDNYKNIIETLTQVKAILNRFKPDNDIHPDWYGEDDEAAIRAIDLLESSIRALSPETVCGGE